MAEPATTTATTTISGVSLATQQGTPGPEVFEIVLSAGGIDFRRTDRRGARLTWDRVLAWDIEQRDGDVVLTLQGAGTDTPLVIPGWSAEDLRARLRQLTEQPGQPKQPTQPNKAKDDARVSTRPGVVELLGTAPTAQAAAAEPATRSEEEAAVRPRRRRSRGPLPWKVVVTVALLGVLATAVTIVLLQSAGIISWSILGPTS